MELTDMKIDQSRKDLAGLCFVSFDPDAYRNPNARQIAPLAEPAKTKQSLAPNASAPALAARQRIALELLGEIQWDSEMHGFCTCPGKQLHTTGDGKRDCEIHLDGAPTVYCFHSHCQGIRDAVNRELRSRIGRAESSPTLQNQP